MATPNATSAPQTQKQTAHHQSNVPIKPGLYYYKMNGGGVWRHQEVVKLSHPCGGQRKGALVVFNGEGPVPVAQMYRHWLPAGAIPPRRR
jgi:hypothetical protein